MQWGYFKAQFKIMIVVALILSLGLAFLKVKYVLLCAILIALLDFLSIFWNRDSNDTVGCIRVSDRGL